MKVAVAARERGESLARPHTPCPLVQPLAKRVPKPTSRPAAMRTTGLAVIVGLVYGAMIALVTYVKVQPREMTQTIPPSKLAK